MDVAFTMTATDLRHFMRYCWLHRPSVLLGLLTSILGAFVLAAWVYSFLYRSQPPVAEWWWMPLAVAVLAFIAWRTNFGVSAAVKASPGLIGGVWLRITPTGVEERTALTDAMVMWVRIQKIVAAPYGLYLFTEPLRAYCVPRRAFATPAEANAFATLARSYWQTARERAGMVPSGQSPWDPDRAV